MFFTTGYSATDILKLNNFFQVPTSTLLDIEGKAFKLFTFSSGKFIQYRITMQFDIVFDIMTALLSLEIV